MLEVPLSVGETDLTIQGRRRQQWEPRVIVSVYRKVLFGFFQQWVWWKMLRSWVWFCCLLQDWRHLPFHPLSVWLHDSETICRESQETNPSTTPLVNRTTELSAPSLALLWSPKTSFLSRMNLQWGAWALMWYKSLGLVDSDWSPALFYLAVWAQQQGLKFKSRD